MTLSKTLVCLMMLIQAGGCRSPRAEAKDYPYRSETFTQFVKDSYGEPAAKGVPEFYGWLEEAYAGSASRYPGQESLGLSELMAAKQEQLAAIPDPKARAKAERDLGAWLHRMVKTVIPKFSLDRGFEFYNAVRLGERQCMLQSVLIAGLLQSAGVDAGMAMVSRNAKGEETNNAHVVALVKLADGTDVLVDASDREPFAHQKGLFARNGGGYRYVLPVYQPGSPVIRGYRPAAGGKEIAPGQFQPLDVAFVRSQFYYYRGERADGAFAAARKTPAGLEAGARHLRESIRLCPQNPLPVYVLGRVYLMQGKTKEARALFTRARGLYAQAGWVPQGPKQYAATQVSR